MPIVTPPETRISTGSDGSSRAPSARDTSHLIQSQQASAHEHESLSSHECLPTKVPPQTTRNLRSALSAVSGPELEIAIGLFAPVSVGRVALRSATVRLDCAFMKNPLVPSVVIEQS